MDNFRAVAISSSDKVTDKTTRLSSVVLEVYKNSWYEHRHARQRINRELYIMHGFPEIEDR